MPKVQLDQFDEEDEDEEEIRVTKPRSSRKTATNLDQRERRL